MTATGVEVFMMTLGPSTRRGGNVMGMTIDIGNGEESGQFGVTTRICTERVIEENKRTNDDASSTIGAHNNETVDWCTQHNFFNRE